MRIFAFFNADGTPTAFYNDEINTDPAKWPKGGTEITFEQWQDFINNDGKRRWNGKAPEPYAPPMPAVTAPVSYALKSDVDALNTQLQTLAKGLGVAKLLGQ